MLWKVLIFLTTCQLISSHQFEVLADNEWDLFKILYKKSYEPEEDEFRRGIFTENKLKIDEHNKLYERNLTSYRMAINHFSDRLPSEISTMHGLRMDMQAPAESQSYRGTKDIITAPLQPLLSSGMIPHKIDVWKMPSSPKSADRRDQGVVAPATGVIEGQE